MTYDSDTGRIITDDSDAGRTMTDDRGAERILMRMYHRCFRYGYVGCLMVMLNSVIDGMIISHFLGGRAAAAFGLVMPFFSLMNLIPILLRYSVHTRIGEYIGRGDTKAARHSLSLLLMTGAAASVPLFLMLSFCRSAAMGMLSAGVSHSAGTLEMALSYMLFLSPCVLPIMLCSVLHPVMQLDGDLRRSPRAIWAAAAVNILGDLLCVLVIKNGMAGIAMATVFSCYTEMLILLLHYRKEGCVLKPVFPFPSEKSFDFRRAKKTCISYAKLFSGGLPFMVRELVAFFSGILMNRIAFNLAGESGLSVLCIGNTIWLFLLPAATAVSSTGTSLGSLVRGESDDFGVHLILKKGVWYAFIPGAILSAAVFAAAGSIAAFCAGDVPEITVMTTTCLRYFALALPMTMFCQAGISHLIVTGWKKCAIAEGIMEGGAVLLAFSWILGKRFGTDGMWAAKPAAALAISLIIVAIIIIARVRESKTRDSRYKTSSIRHIESSVSDADEVIRFSEQVREFCLNNGLTHRLSSLAALTVEELACNTLEWGYDSETTAVVDIRAVYNDGHLTLRFRDSAMLFDPLLYTRQFVVTDHDPARNIGLRIVSGLAKDMRYSCVADCNIVLLKIC